MSLNTCEHPLIQSGSPGKCCVICGKRQGGRKGRTKAKTLAEAFALGQQVAAIGLPPNEPVPLCAPYLMPDGSLRVPDRKPKRWQPPEGVDLQSIRIERELASELLPEDAAEILRKLVAERCRRSLYQFVRESWHVLEPGTDFDDNWHILFICLHLQAMIEDWRKRRILGPEFKQRCQKLLVNIPPGTAKSRIISVCLNAWIWIESPEFRLICVSGNPDSVKRDANFTRQLITSEWYRGTFEPSWSLRDDQDAVSNFANTAGGSRQSKGLNSQFVGQRADAIVWDDPNSPTGVFSEAERNSVIRKWDQELGNRLNQLDVSLCIGVMQRLHENDLAGHVLRQGWLCIILPMEYEKGHARETFLGMFDPRTEEGELLHSGRFPASVLAAERVRLGSYGYAGQMQQRPVPLGGGMFKRAWWRFCRIDGRPAGPHPRPTGCTDADPELIEVDRKSGRLKLDWISVTIDAAFKGKETSDPVGLLVVGGRGAWRFVLDNRTRQMTFNETCAAIRQILVDWACPEYIVEAKANGDAIVDYLNAEIPGMILVEPEGGKTARAAAIMPACEAGNVFLLDGAHWIDDFVTEISLFPNGKHDDQVDALTQLLIKKAPAAYGTLGDQWG